MRPISLAASFGLAFAVIGAAQETPVSLAAWPQARIATAMEKYFPPGATLKFLSPEISRISNRVRLFNLTVTGSNDEPFLRADSATLERWQRGGKVLSEEFHLEKAVYSDAFLKQVFTAAKNTREAIPKAAPTPNTPGMEGSEPSPSETLSPALEAWMNGWLRSPFDLGYRLRLEPVARTLTLDPMRMDWGPHFKAEVKGVLDGVEGADLDALAPMLRRLSGLKALGESNQVGGFMAPPRDGQPGMRELSAVLTLEDRQFDIKRFFDRLQIQNPVVLGILAHPLFPQQPALRGEIRVSLDREKRAIVLSPLAVELLPGFELRLELALSDFPFGSFSGVSSLAGFSAKTNETNEGVFDRLSLKFTDSGALAMALGIGGAFMGMKPDAARRQLLAMTDNLGQAGIAGKPIPPEVVKLLRDFIAGRRNQLTLRLKAKTSLNRLGGESSSLFDLFMVE
jgi:hypothetical protein